MRGMDEVDIHLLGDLTLAERYLIDSQEILDVRNKVYSNIFDYQVCSTTHNSKNCTTLLKNNFYLAWLACCASVNTERLLDINNIFNGQRCKASRWHT